MSKYFSEKNKYVVDEPSLLTINGSVDILYAGGTEHKDGEFTILIGNIESYNPTEIEQEPVPNPNPTPTEPDEPEGGSGGDNEGGNSGGQEGGGDNPETPINPDPMPSGNGNLTIKVNNNTGGEIRLCGEVRMNISRSPSDTTWSNVIEIPVHFVSTHSQGWANETNDRVISNNSYTTWTCTVDNLYLDGTYGIMENHKDVNEYMVPLYLYCKYYSKSKNAVSQGNGIYHTVTTHQILQPNGTIEVTVNRLKSDAMMADNNTTINNIPSDKNYVVLRSGELSL